MDGLWWKTLLKWMIWGYPTGKIWMFPKMVGWFHPQIIHGLIGFSMNKNQPFWGFHPYFLEMAHIRWWAKKMVCFFLCVFSRAFTSFNKCSQLGAWEIFRRKEMRRVVNSKTTQVPFFFLECRPSEKVITVDGFNQKFPANLQKPVFREGQVGSWKIPWFYKGFSTNPKPVGWPCDFWTLAGHWASPGC